ncbi:MAG TPA: ABC transporter permease [Blastocatellia bacterium]|nr:ABC transporter permease [Blastocatellia bacterium]
MQTLWQDLRYGTRMLIKQPGFTLIAVLTLALGIGANLTIFSFVDTMFLRPLPAREPERLVNVEATRNGRWSDGHAYPTYVHYRDHCQSFEALVAHYSTAPVNIVADGDSRVTNGAVVSANYFSVLGIQPRLGRFFLPEEDSVPDRDPVVVISHTMWDGRFGGDPAVLGKELVLNGSACKIIGVTPPGFQGVLAGFPNEFWIPTMMLRLGYRWCDAIAEVDCRPLSLLGRLAPGRTLADAQAELSVLSDQLAATSPAQQGRGVLLKPALGVRFDEREGYRYQMQLLMAVTGLLLLIACANVASLLLVRGAARRKEIAIRLCIGAGRPRLVRQFLTESLLIAFAGGGLGLLISLWAKDLLVSFYTTTSSSMQRYYDLSLSPRGLVYALALTLFTGLLFGLLPALQATRQDPLRDLKEGISPSPHQHRLRGALVVGQVALSLSLLVVAGLLVRSESHVRDGANFDPQHVAALRLRPALMSYNLEKAQAFTREAVGRLEALPGVQSVSLATGGGLAWRSGGKVGLRLPEEPRRTAEEQLQVDYQEIAPRFCETLKIPLLEGREFNDGDRPGAPRVTVINETLARRLWPEGSALGGALMVRDQPYQVVGVSKDAQLLNALEPPQPFLYLAYLQNTTRTQIDARLVVRLAGDPQAMLPLLRRTIVTLDPNVPISEDVPLTQQVNAVYMPVLLTSAGLTSAGLVALFLSMLGLYGVLAFAVSQRTREIGIRMALGAERLDVLRLVVTQGLRLAFAGVGIGLLASYAATRLVKSLLYGVSATDPMTFLLIAGLLSLVALLACWLPARRATKVDPMVALRYE